MLAIRLLGRQRHGKQGVLRLHGSRTKRTKEFHVRRPSPAARGPTAMCRVLQRTAAASTASTCRRPSPGGITDLAMGKHSSMMVRPQSTRLTASPLRSSFSPLATLCSGEVLVAGERGDLPGVSRTLSPTRSATGRHPESALSWR